MSTRDLTIDEKNVLAFQEALTLAKARTTSRDRVSKNATSDGLAGNQNAGSSFTAAFARSFVLLLGIYFKRPGRLFRPTRVDTLTSLRQLALSSHQSLTPSFIRALIKEKGPKTIILSLLPPLAINTSLGFLLFTSHTYFSWILAKLPAFRPRLAGADEEKSFWEDLKGILSDEGLELEMSGDGGGPNPVGSPQDPAIPDNANDQKGLEEIQAHINMPFSLGADQQLALMESLHRLPHPTALAVIAGVGAGALQGIAFTPIENAIKLIQRGTLSWLDAFRKVFHISRPSALRSHLSSSLAHSPASRFPRSMTDLRAFLGLSAGGGILAAWKGVRWSIRRDAVSYGLFFGCFDVSRRVGLRVKKWMLGDTSGRGARKGLAKTSGPSTPRPEDTLTQARLAQAGCLIVGGISASLLAEYASRPFRHMEDLVSANERRAPGLAFTPQHQNTRGTVRPFSHGLGGGGGGSGSLALLRNAIRRDGFGSFFHNPATLTTPLSERGFDKQRTAVLARSRGARFQAKMSALGWKLVGVGPWGFGFLVFAYLGGEV